MRSLDSNLETRFRELSGGMLADSLIAPVDGHHRVPLAPEPARDDSADSFGTTGDECLVCGRGHGGFSALPPNTEAGPVSLSRSTRDFHRCPPPGRGASSRQREQTEGGGGRAIHFGHIRHLGVEAELAVSDARPVGVIGRRLEEEKGDNLALRRR